MSAELEADISYLKQVAEQGQKAPLQGGEHDVIWGGMFTASALYALCRVDGSYSAGAMDDCDSVSHPDPAGSNAHA